MKKTKKQEVVEALEKDDLKAALRVASHFRRDFAISEQRIITRAHEFDQTSMYAEMGFDKERTLAEAERLLREKYNVPRRD